MTTATRSHIHRSDSVAHKLAVLASNGGTHGVSGAKGVYDALLGPALRDRAAAGPKNWAVVKRRRSASDARAVSAESAERQVLACALQLRMSGREELAAVLEKLLDMLVETSPGHVALATLQVICALARPCAGAPRLGKLAEALLDEEAAVAREKQGARFHFTADTGVLEPSLRGLLDDVKAASRRDDVEKSDLVAALAGTGWMCNASSAPSPSSSSEDEVSEFFDAVSFGASTSEGGREAFARSDLFGALVQRTLRKSSKMYRDASVKLSVPALRDDQDPPELAVLQQLQYAPKRYMSPGTRQNIAHDTSSTCTTEESDDEVGLSPQRGRGTGGRPSTKTSKQPDTRKRLTRATPEEFERVLAIASGFGKLGARPFACEDRSLFVQLSGLSRGCPTQGLLTTSKVPLGVSQAAFRQFSDAIFEAFKQHSRLEELLQECDRTFDECGERLEAAVGQAFASGMRMILSFLDSANLRLEHTIASSEKLPGLLDDTAGRLLLCGFRKALQPFLASLASVEQLLNTSAMLPSGNTPWQAFHLLCKELSWLQLVSPDVLLRSLASSENFLHQKTKLVFVFLLLTVVAKPLFAHVRRQLLQCNTSADTGDAPDLNDIPSFLHTAGRAKYASALQLLGVLRQSATWSAIASISAKEATLLEFPASVRQYNNHRRLQAVICKRLRRACKITYRRLAQHWKQPALGPRRSSASNLRKLASQEAVVLRRQQPFDHHPPPASVPAAPAPKPRHVEASDSFEPQFLFEKSFDEAVIRQARQLVMERYGEKIMEAEQRRRLADWRRRQLMTLPGRRHQLGTLLNEDALRWLDSTAPEPRVEPAEPPAVRSVASTPSVLQLEKPDLEQVGPPSGAHHTHSPLSSSDSDATRELSATAPAIADHAPLRAAGSESDEDELGELQPALSILVGKQPPARGHRRAVSSPVDLSRSMQSSAPAAGMPTGHGRGNSLSGIRVLQPTGGFSSIDLRDAPEPEVGPGFPATSVAADAGSLPDTEVIDSVLMGFEVDEDDLVDSDMDEGVVSATEVQSEATATKQAALLDSLKLEWEAAEFLSPVQYPDILLNVLADHSPDNASQFQRLHAMTETPIECILDQTARRTISLQCELIEAATLGYLLDEVKVLQHLDVLQRTLLLTPRGDVITSFVPTIFDEILLRSTDTTTAAAAAATRAAKGAVVLNPLIVHNIWLGLAKDVVGAGSSPSIETVLDCLSLELRPQAAGSPATLVSKNEFLFGDALFGEIVVSYRPPPAVNLVLRQEAVQSLFAVHRTLTRVLQLQAAGTLVWKEMKPRRGSMRHAVAARMMSMLYGLCASARTVFISYLSNELIGAHGWLSKRIRSKASAIRSPATLRKFMDTYAARMCRSTLSLDASASFAEQHSADRVVVRASEAFEQLRRIVMRCLQILYKHANETTSVEECCQEVLHHANLLRRAVADLDAKLRFAVDATSASTQVSLQALLALLGSPEKWKIA